jgi:protein-L-isoaspartate(D-aspartate) O-methyltransferase
MTRKAHSRILSTAIFLLFCDNPYRSIIAEATNIGNDSSVQNNSKISTSAFVSSTGAIKKKPSADINSKTTAFYANSPEGETSANSNKPNDNNIMRAWTCHGRNQRDLVDRMMQAKIVRTDSVRDVLTRVDRQHYAPPAPPHQQQQSSPYMDSPQPIGLGQTISAPHMHAHVLEEIYPFLKASKASHVKILDVGCGSGYLTAALGRWVAPLQDERGGQTDSHGSLLDSTKTGHVYGIDIFPHLVELTKHNMEKADQDLLDRQIVSVQVSNGWKGLPDASPFDVIHVGAAAAEFPRALLQQLKVGGVLIIPVGPDGGVQNLYRVERLSDGFTQEDFRITELLGVRYVPLVQQPPQQAN